MLTDALPDEVALPELEADAFEDGFAENMEESWAGLIDVTLPSGSIAGSLDTPCSSELALNQDARQRAAYLLEGPPSRRDEL